MACKFGKEAPGGFYCPVAEMVFLKKGDIPFCRDYEQQARCGNGEHERLVQRTDNLNKSGLNLGDVEGMFKGERGGKKHYDQR